MGTTKKKKKSNTKAKSLSNGRPPLLNQRPITLSSKATRTLIRSHHNTLKSYAKAVQDGDTVLADRLSGQLTEDDLKKYQLASQIGQSATRGGDSSKVLVDWLAPFFRQHRVSEPAGTEQVKRYRVRVLEVGALSTSNAISQVSELDATRIDLHSQGPGILEQDFMERPVPEEKALDEKFHILSLSLVLNFVPDAKARGDMLKRCTKFLLAPADFLPKTEDSRTHSSTTSQPPTPPCLFLVLPAPCVTNSRYLTTSHLLKIMATLNFTLIKEKTTAKLYYSLWRYDPARFWTSSVRIGEQKEGGPPTIMVFKKKELVGGSGRNNFAVVLE